VHVPAVIRPEAVGGATDTSSAYQQKYLFHGPQTALPWQLRWQARLESQQLPIGPHVVLFETHGLAGTQAPAVVFGIMFGSKLAT
jgi:hypothetical protein